MIFYILLNSLVLILKGMVDTKKSTSEAIALKTLLLTLVKTRRMKEKQTSLDKFDREILNIVQKQSRETVEHIGEKIGLSAASVQRRLKRMRENGTIISDISVIAPESVGRTMTFVVAITMERDKLDLFDLFKKEVNKNDMVQQCYFITGNADCILIVTATDMDEYNEFSKKFLFNNSNIRGFHTSVVMDSAKVGLFVPTENKQQ